VVWGCEGSTLLEARLSDRQGTGVRFPPAPRKVVVWVPLDDEARRRGLERSLEVRREKAARRREKELAIRRVVSETDDLAPAAFRTVLELIRQVEDGLDGLTVGSPLDAQRLASAAETLHRIGRLASGQSTANVAHAQTMTDEERKERMAYLRSRVAAMTVEEGLSDAV